MLIEDGFLAKVLAALGAGEGLLTRMDAYVLVENGALPKTARAVWAGEGLFVGVDAQMLCKVRLLAKAFAALGAREGSCVRVDAVVLQQRALLLEVLAAGEALEEPQVAVWLVLVRASWSVARPSAARHAHRSHSHARSRRTAYTSAPVGSRTAFVGIGVRWTGVLLTVLLSRQHFGKRVGFSTPGPAATARLFHWQNALVKIVKRWEARRCQHPPLRCRVAGVIIVRCSKTVAGVILRSAVLLDMRVA